MGTTIWVDEETREELRRLQELLGKKSANETIRYLIAQPVPDARSLFHTHRSQIEPILRNHGIRRLIAFGSRARGDARPTSDLDLAVEIDKDVPPLSLIAAEAELEEVLGIPVHLVELPNKKIERTLEKEGVALAG